MRAFAIVFNEQAAREIDDARAWLTEHRGPVRVAELDDELGRTLRLLEAHPDMYALAPGSKTVRRLPLGRSRYHVYYRVFHAQERIVVIRFWHANRRPPRL